MILCTLESVQHARRNLSNLLLLHAVVTFAAGVALIAVPGWIPQQVGINIDPSAYLVCYLLGSYEFGLAWLSYQARYLTDARSLRLVCSTFIVVHASTAAVELYSYARGVGTAIWGNIALRVVVVGLFAYVGLRTTSGETALVDQRSD